MTAHLLNNSHEMNNISLSLSKISELDVLVGIGACYLSISLGILKDLGNC